MGLGALTLLPPLLIIAVALKTKKTTSSLLLGVLLCCILQYGVHFVPPLIDLMYRVGTDEGTVWIALFTALFGCFIELLSVSGGTEAFINLLERRANTPRRTMVLSWLAGILVFFDDFTSVVIRGMMTKLYDRNKLPRAMLSYITDATASPMCILIPFGTWAVFYQSLFSGYEEVTSLGPVFRTYSQAVPFMFYGWAALFIALLAAAGVLKPMGAMKKAFQRAEETGELYSPESRPFNPPAMEGDGTQKAGAKALVCFLVPLAVLVAVALATLDALVAVIVTIGIMVPLYLVLRVTSWSKMMDACMRGIVSLTSMIVIVFMAYMLKEAISDIGLPAYIISLVQPFMSARLLPVITFVACTILTFTTGSNWGGTVGVTAIVIPLAGAIGANMPLILGAIVSGAAFGAHVCFYTDVTIFTSTITKIDNQEHAITQLPYGLLGMAISVAAYLAAGFLCA